MKYIKIENITIGQNSKPFIIAEISGNHNQSLDRAFEIIDAAAKAGAHVLKKFLSQKNEISKVFFFYTNKNKLFILGLLQRKFLTGPNNLSQNLRLDYKLNCTVLPLLIDR